MLARIARELFWLGRNVARAEHTSRMLDGAFQADLQALPEDPVSVPFGWGPMLAILGDGSAGEARSREDVVAALTLDRSSPISIPACVARARESARMVRDVISTETWEALNTTHLELQARTTPEALAAGPDALLRYVRERAALFWGLTTRTMLRDEARAFLLAGGRYESADMVLRMLLVTIPPEGTGAVARDGHAQALLRAVGGLQAYHRARSTPPDAEPVARFLLFEGTYPDSVASSLLLLRAALEAADQQPRSSEPVLRLGRMSADLELRRRAKGHDLVEICTDVGSQLARVERDIAERYFSGALAAPGVVTA